MSYVATITGQYYNRGDKDKINYKPYKLRFRLSSCEKPLSDIVKYLLADALTKKYPDSEGYVTHHLESIYNEQNPQDVINIPILFMSYEQLDTYVKLNRLTYVDVSRSINLDTLRVEVAEAHTNGETSYKKLIELRQKKKKDEQEVLAGGHLIEDDDETQEVEMSIGTTRTSSGDMPIGSTIDDDDDTPATQPNPVKPKVTKKKTAKKVAKPAKPEEEFTL